MKINLFYISFIFVISFIFCLPTFSYSELVGKEVELHGPFCWDILGVALDEDISTLFVKVANLNDKEGFKDLLNSYRVIRIPKNSKAVVLDVKIFENKAKVLLLTGLYRGTKGWVPLSWLDKNEKLPTFIDR